MKWVRIKRNGVTIFCSLIVSFLGITAVYAQISGEERVLQMESLYLSHLAAFTTWPTEKYKSNAEPVRIGVLGAKAQEFVDFYRAHGIPSKGQIRSISIFTIDDNPMTLTGPKREECLDHIRSCHILYILSSENDWLDWLFDELANEPILAIGETNRFLKLGGMASFVADENHTVKVWVDLNRVEEKNIKIGALFLQHAKIVNMDSGSL